MHWIWENREWLFSGVGVGILTVAYYVIRRFFRPSTQPGKSGDLAAMAHGTALAASGSNISQNVNSPTLVNSPTINLSLAAPPTGAPGRERYEEWRELIHELHESLAQIWCVFLPLNVITPGIEDNDYNAGIRRGYRVIRNRILIAEPLKQARLLEKYNEIVQYALSVQGPRDPKQRGCPTMGGFETKARAFEDELMEIARKDMGA